MTPASLYLGFLLAAFSVPAQIPHRELPPEAGVYLGWVGSYSGNRLQEGARLAKESGFQTIRAPLVASFETDFGIGIVCHGNQSLEALVSLVPYAKVLGDPSFRTIFLTTWGDSSSYDACEPRNPRSDQHPHKRYLDPQFYSSEAHRDRMRAEYAGLTYSLYKTYQGTGKTFGISNWEGDNDLYCDGAAYYVIDPAFRAACDKKRTTAGVFDAYRKYLQLREEGIAAGRKRALNDGLTGVKVISVIEVSALRLLKEKGLPDMLSDVIPSVSTPDYISYSAWESIGLPAVQLTRDLDGLSLRFHNHLFVGEFGFDRGLDSSAPARAAGVLQTLLTAHVPYAIWWQIFDQPPLLGLGDKGLYGLYDQAGHLTPTGIKFRESFSNPK